MSQPQEHSPHYEEHQAPQSRHQQHHQPVNFSRETSYPSRRVTIGGGAMPDERRGSLASFNVDDFFGRRPSMGMADMDALFGRRDSIDSSSAAFDAALFADWSRRRFSMLGASSNDMPPSSFPPPPGSNLTPGNIAQRQQQLQQQQRELEQRQKELEIQRQQLIQSMQERNTRGSSLGLGSVHSMGSQGSYHTSTMPNRATSMGSAMGASAAMAGPQGQWWVCQICNQKAFASHDEAMDHEQTCQGIKQEGHHHLPNQSQRSMYSQHSDYTHASRQYSMGMDTSTASYENPQISHGPFALMEKPMPLAMPSDKDWLTPLHCFVRGHCVEVFTATEREVSTPSKGKRKPIQVGQVGIRCPHCHSADPSKNRERGSVYYPTSIASIYNATMNLLQRHLHSCAAVPDEIMRRYETLKADDARSGTSKKYWVESALSLGLVDTLSGIRFSALEPPPLAPRQPEQGLAPRRTSMDLYSNSSNAQTDEKGDEKPAAEEEAASPLVDEEDRPYATAFSYQLLRQMQPCRFTEADRLGKRKGLPPGFPGLACRHCFGGYGSGRFFPSSIKTLSDTSKTLNVLHNHMMRCRKCPAETRESLEKLRGSHDDERSKMKFGSQKAFFARVWERLHGKGAPPAALKRKAPPPPANYPTMTDPRMMGYGGMGGPPPQMHPNMKMPPQTAMGGGLDALARASDPKRQRMM